MIINMKYIFSIFFFLVMHISLFSQGELFGISTSWDDSYKEWVIYAEDEDVEGELEVRWGGNDDWSDWDYRYEDESGSIKQKWNNDISQWELRGGNEIITMKTKWTNDFTEWRISTGSKTFTLVSKYKNNLQEWEVKEKTYGTFEMYTSYENDLRDWDIFDDLDEEITFHTKMAIVFVVMYNSTPKF